MGNAEIKTLHLSVSSVKNRAVGFFEPRNPLSHIHFSRIFAASQTERLITFFWKYLEPIRRQPRTPPLRILPMAFMPLDDSLFRNLRQLHLKGIKMRDGGSAGRHITFRLLAEFEKIVVIATILHLFCPLISPLANRKKSRPGRQGESFLGAAKHHVEA